MSVKNLHDTISDLMASSSSASKRSKTIESIKNRLIEWPESVDDYSRLLLGLMAVGGSGRTTNLSQCLCAIDTLVGDLSKSVPPNFLEGDTYSAIQKLSKKIIEFSTQLLPVVACQEGAVEYMCKLVKTLSGGLFPLTLESTFPAGLVVGLLQVPIKRPRQEDLIKASVWSVVENFNSDLTFPDVSTLLSQSLSLFQRSDKTNDMVFAVQFTLWTLQRAPLLVRNFATGYPQIVQDIFEILCGLVPLLPEKVVDCLGLVCVVMLSLGSSVSFDVNNWYEILSVLSEQRVRVSRFSDFFFKIIDLSVDILLLKTGSFKAALELPECENDEHLQTRLVERWCCLDQFKDYFFVEKQIENSIVKNFLLLTSALVNKLVTPPGTSVPMHFSALFIPNQPRGDKVPTSRGGEAVMHRLKKLILTQIFVNSKPEIGPLTCALTLAENNLITDPQLESSFPNWISNIDKHDTNACFVATRLVPYFQRSFSSLENIVFALSSSVEPKNLYNFIMNLVGVVPRWNCEISLLERLRDALCFRPVPTAPPNSSTGSAAQQRKATSFVARLVKRAIDSNNDPDALCHLLAVYVLIGASSCEACLVTQGLSAASKGPASKAFFLLKKALIEATELLHPIVLCQCSLHTDSMGEPRSLLSQDPLSVASVMGGELRKSASIALEECIVGAKLLVRKKLQRLDSLHAEEMLRIAQDLEDVGSRIEILIHLTGKKSIVNFSQYVAKLALIISKTDQDGRNETLLSFLAEAVFSQSGGAFTPLVASREIIPVLLAAFSPPDVVRDILAVPTGGALHLSAALSPHVSRIERIALLTRIFQQTDDALYMIDQLRIAFPSREVKRIVAALVAACDEKNSIPPEFIDFIAAELQIEDLVEGLTGGVAMRLLSGEDGWKEEMKGVHSPLDVLLLSLELKEISSTSGKNDPILAIQSVVRLSERPWFMLYVAHLHPDETCDYVSALIGPSSCKKQRICDEGRMDWIRFLDVCDRKNIRKIDVKNLLFASVYCVTYTDLSLHVPLMYALQALVSDVGIVGEVIRFFLGPDAMLPDAFRNQSLRFSWKREYPVTPVCRLVVELLEKCANFQDAEMNILSALKSVAAVEDRIAESVFPFLLFLFAENMEIAGIINEGMTWKCCSAISEALIIAKQIEFVFSKSSETIAVPDSRCKITNLLQRINLSLLSDELLLDPYSFGESNFHAYFFSSLFFHQPCSSLFSKPCASLPRVLQALTQIGVEINSFTLSFHPSIRGTVSRLRKDYLSLLYEEDACHVSFGMTALGLSKGDGEKIDLTPTAGSEELLDHLQRLISQPASVLSHNACQAIYDLLKDKSSFPPRTHDKHNETILKLVEFLRKSNMTHNARIIADWSISETLTDTTCPAIRLGLFYSLSKILWSLSLFPEATQVLTNLTVSEEISRTDIPAVASMAPRIYSRAALWVGQRRVESLEAIRVRYFAKAVRSGVDLKNEIKAKMRFVRVIDPSIVSSTPSAEIVEQFTLLCEILVSGVVSSAKSVWFASRLVSLWFTFPNPTTPVVAKFRKALAACESLLPFFYQIAGRIGRSGNENENLEFRKELLLFIIECAKIHTSVCLPPILQLTGNANKNKNAQTVERSKQAEMIVEKLRSGFPTLVDSMKAAFRFYLNLAMAPVVEVVGQGTSTRPASKHKRLVNEIEGFKEYASFFSNENCPVLTSTVSIVKSIHPEFAVAESGRSLPKILTVIDFEGKHHKQIVKGNDDLRNDAVLQQLFSLLDAVITTSKMRSYKVVPITASAGIAEWVSNTVTLGGYLVGFPSEESGAHMRYHPEQITPSGFKAKMVNIRQQQKKSPEAAALFNEYKSLSESFSPAMRYFFYEHFSTPKSWFHAQTCFAHSVAATSIVGFIVGLGDRHPNNILIDLKTGEVVHIDYGICFDAGRQLKIPEIVPFRLTRDMVDGLGCLGTQGPFSKTCEDVLIGLKNNSALVTAVVEVFVVDPLFNWAVASLGSDNAHSALQGVKRKLQGFLDDADVLPLTPAAQVDRLIRMATEPRYLCQMFAGWQPWL